MQGPDGDGAAAVDSNAWSGGQRMPTAEEFSQFFLYIAFDAISERCNALALGQEPGQQEQQQQQPPYRKFVQGNKDTPWARDLLASVARVQACKAHYRAMLPMLLSRNMGPLHRVCMDITSSNVPPHREVHGFERCFITGVWHDRCIDVSKGCRHNPSSPPYPPAPPSSSSSPPCHSPSMHCHHNGTSGPSTPACSPAASGASSAPPQQQQQRPTPGADAARPASRSSHASSGMAAAHSSGGGSGGGGNGAGVFISPRFRHFAQMLWTVAKVDCIVKNYTLAWLHSQGLAAAGRVHLPSRQALSTRFSEECGPFRDGCFRIFCHAVPHVCRSLHEHMYKPMFSPAQTPSPAPGSVNGARAEAAGAATTGLFSCDVLSGEAMDTDPASSPPPAKVRRRATLLL